MLLSPLRRPLFSSSFTVRTLSTMAEAKVDDPRKLPAWRMPRPMKEGMSFYDQFYPLKVYNSLTRTKVPFIPMSGGKRVLWYQCGPTVYDSAHMGHARTYLSLDILRRIMTGVFGYDMLVVMNITNLDDKIIMRANERGISHEELSSQYEAEFMSDMAKLGVLPPHALTRVTEYVPQIVEFVEKLISKGFAYASNGSVYFDVDAFGSDPRHEYGKLVPENVGNIKELEEGEGALTATGDKRAPQDFALWKASKPGEPSWPSPWGPGRPGWHIECSVMAADAMKDYDGVMDVHAGGWDLRFPHHENEIAQSEACLGCTQWVNYFLHTGHLHIDGRKMSKSLKNFIKINESLESFTARQIRFLFVNTRYNKPMMYSADTMQEVVALDKDFSNFFQNVKLKLRESTLDKPQMWGDRERELATFLLDTRQRVRDALCDDFDTPTALAELKSIRDRWTAWMVEVEFPVRHLLAAGAEYVTEMFEMFGLINADPSIGFPVGGAAGDAEATLAPVLDAFAAFRTEVRAAARSGDAKAILKACDMVRDDALPAVGVKMEDKDSGTVWKLVSAEEVARERAERDAVEAAAAERKAELARLAEERAAKARIPPVDLFRSDPAFSAFDEQGIPTHSKDGTELTKSARGKKAKEMKKHVAAHEKQLKKDAAAAAAAGAGAE